MKKSQKLWPESIAEAIKVLDAILSDEDKVAIRGVQLTDLHLLHQGLGTVIRNEFGLWAGNNALMTCTLEVDADLASMTIVREYWDHLNRQSSSIFH